MLAVAILAIDALVLIALLKVINEDEVDFLTAFLVALVASIGTAVLAAVLAVALGFPGLILAAAIAALLLGAAVSLLFGVEIKRSFLIAGIFLVVHITVAIGFQLMLRG